MNRRDRPSLGMLTRWRERVGSRKLGQELADVAGVLAWFLLVRWPIGARLCVGFGGDLEGGELSCHCVERGHGRRVRCRRRRRRGVKNVSVSRGTMRSLRRFGGGSGKVEPARGSTVTSVRAPTHASHT